MVLHKSLYYGFNGYQVPSFPRASRSARGKSSLKRKADEKEMCAFELLATVAGELLQEGGNCLSASNTAEERVLHSVRQEEQDEKKPLKVDSFDESGFVSDLNLQGQIPNKNLEQSPHPKHDIGLEHTSVMANASFLDKYDCTEVGSGEKRKDFVKFSSKICGRSPGYGEPCSNVVEKTEGQLESERKKFSNVTNGSLPDTCSTENPMELDISPPTLASLDKSVEVPHTSFLPFQANAKLVCKDNDENSSACTHPSTRNLKAFRPPPRIGDRRIRRLLASKYWKISHKYNDRELSRHDMRHVFRNVKSFYTHQRSQYQRNSNFRKRKLLEHRSISKSDARSQSEGISKPYRKGGINEDATNSASRPSLVAPQESSFQSRDSRVKLSIKSFRVPELFIEIPESATVGSLKRTVTEAVSAILGGGLCVGVVLQGKKVRDDNKTLLQTGISHDDKLDALGFMLEPNPSPTPASAPAPQPLCHVDPPFLMSYNIPQPLSRYPKTPGGDPVPFDASPNPTLANGGTSVENAIVVDSSPRVVKAENTAFDPGALILNSTMVEPLTAVPLDRKSAQSELAQRRIRRPFSVSEVEALVQAVEKLGTGRWRDVKLLAFDNVEHRTYVDLKDKWKTLVHTAKISPGQRRGEPVPQELLDRVLAAHGHWSQEQAKQQIKLPSETCLHLFKPIEERSTLAGGSLEF